MAKLNGDSIMRSWEFKGPLPYTALRAHTQFAELTAAAVCLGVECLEMGSVVVLACTWCPASTEVNSSNPDFSASVFHEPLHVFLK